MTNEELVIKNRNNKLNETNYNKCGELMRIIEYNNAHDIIIEFDCSKTTIKTSYQKFKNGNVKDNFYKSVCGVGYLGNTSTSKNKKVKHSYRIWLGMIRRCYNPRGCYDKMVYYKDCSVCDEWLCYANFEKWYNENYYEVNNEEMNLDKDILVKGNKIYSPNTCIFVPQRINTLFIKGKGRRGQFPMGVSYDKTRKNFRVLLNIDRKIKTFSRYKTKEEAFLVYKQAKEKYIKQVADEYKDKIPKRLYDAMYKYEIEITD